MLFNTNSYSKVLCLLQISCNPELNVWWTYMILQGIPSNLSILMKMYNHAVIPV